jgi:hypothetical protein
MVACCSVSWYNNLLCNIKLKRSHALNSKSWKNSIFKSPNGLLWRLWTTSFPNYRDTRTAEGLQAKGQMYLPLSYASHSFIKKEENIKIMFLGVNYVWSWETVSFEMCRKFLLHFYTIFYILVLIIISSVCVDLFFFRTFPFSVVLSIVYIYLHYFIVSCYLYIHGLVYLLA